MSPREKNSAHIVGRETADLNQDKVLRASLESLSESTCDGIVAPLFYLFLGGIPLAMAYKAVSTLDSMIGYRTERYFYFGKFAARLDDVDEFCPSPTHGFVHHRCDGGGASEPSARFAYYVA